MAACDVSPNLPKVKAKEAMMKLIAKAQKDWRREGGISRSAGTVPDAAAAAMGRGASSSAQRVCIVGA